MATLDHLAEVIPARSGWPSLPCVASSVHLDSSSVLVAQCGCKTPWIRLGRDHDFSEKRHGVIESAGRGS